MAEKNSFVSYTSLSEDDQQHLFQNPCVNEASTEYGTIKQEVVSERPFMSKGRIFRNLFILNISYLLFFTGFWGLTNLQSTMNAAGGIGPDSQAVIYGISMVSSLFLPKITIEKFGCKKVLVFCLLLGLPYLASNGYLRWDLLLSSAALIGLMAGPFGSALTVYIDEIAIRFQEQSSLTLEHVMAAFFGMYVISIEATQIFGNAIAFVVLSNRQPSNPTNLTSHFNCGIDFDIHANDSNSNLQPPLEHERILLVGIYVALGCLSVVLVGFFLDPLLNDLKEGSGWRSAWDQFSGALKHMANTQQILLFPLSIYLGVESAFYSNEYTEAYIACSWGVHHVGFVTICFGVCGALMSLLVGPLVKCISQMAVIIFAACANVAMCILLFLWEPSPETTSIYFVIAGVWGMGDAIWWSQVTALYGLMFPNDREAAFSNLYFWSFLGFFISYSYANYLSVSVKINILLAFLLTGMLGYLIGQLKIKCSTKKEYILIEEGE